MIEDNRKLCCIECGGPMTIVRTLGYEDTINGVTMNWSAHEHICACGVCVIHIPFAVFENDRFHWSKPE